MLDDQALRLIGREVGQGQTRFKQFADIGDRERGQARHTKLTGKCRVRWGVLRPIKLGLRHEPGGEDGQREVVLPGSIFLCAEVVPTQVRFRLAVGAFNAISQTFQLGQPCK